MIAAKDCILANLNDTVHQIKDDLYKRKESSPVINGKEPNFNQRSAGSHIFNRSVLIKRGGQKCR